MADFNDFMDDMNERIDAFMDENAREIRAGAIGLDHRCYNVIVIPGYAIAVRQQNDQALQYYGGFEYVDPAARKTLGDFVFYMADDDRVMGLLERYDELEKKDG